MNVGILTVIWSVTPFWIAIFEYIFYGQKLKIHYILGMILIIICAVVLSLNQVFAKLSNGSSNTEEVSPGLQPYTTIPSNISIAVIPSWLAVLIALITTTCFTTRVIFFRKLTRPEGKMNFDVNTLIMGSFLYPNIPVLIIALFWWNLKEPVDVKSLILGTLSSLMEVLARVSMYTAL